MNTYMGFDRRAGSQEGACLIFAHSAKEARRIGHPQVSMWFGTPWIDMAVRKISAPHLMAEAVAEKLAADEPHVIDCPNVCTTCETWGGRPLANGCEYCQDDEA